MSKTLGSLTVGAKIEVPVLSAYQSRFGSKIVFKIADKNHSGYPSNSVTLITEKIIQNMASDAKEPSNSNSDRKNYGNNRHIYSNLLQWLNSNAAAGAWYSAKHSADQAPTTKNTHVTYNPYTSWAGFLAMLDPKFVAELMETTLTVVKSSTDGGSYETFKAKMFLASTTEVGLANENNIAEGSLLALFSNDASRVAYPTAQCVNNADGYTNSGFATSKGWYWWLRTPHSSNANGVRIVYSDGSLSYSGAWTQVQASASRTFTEAVSTAWNTLKYRVRAKDSYGNYSAYTTSGDIAVIHNQPPVISGSNADLGIKRADFTYQYSVTDPDGDTVNVVEKIDGKTIATKNAITLGATQTLSVSGNTFTALTNAQHTITITATDSAGNSAVRTLTFTKSIAGFVITLSAPLEANSQPTRANIKVTRDIPAGGTFKVEATNNPFDASPVWEDCTNAVVQGVAHVFTNKINTAAQYGMNIRVTVQRGDALTACWVSGIGGNFE